MEIRRAKDKDTEGILELLDQVGMVHHVGRPDLFRAGRKYTPSQLTEIIEDDARPIFVAVDEKELVMGYAFCVHKQILNDNILTDIKTLYIDDLCVRESLRGQHIGKALYEAVLLYAKQNAFYNVTLNVWAFNENAKRFYESVGLTPQKIGMEKIL